jgi:hypothetical protein
MNAHRLWVSRVGWRRWKNLNVYEYSKIVYLLLIDLVPTIEIVRVKLWSADAKIYVKKRIVTTQ